MPRLQRRLCAIKKLMDGEFESTSLSPNGPILPHLVYIWEGLLTVEVAAEVVAVTAEMEDAMTTMVVAVVDTVVAEVVAAVVVEDMEAVAAVDLPLLITEAVHEEITAHVPDLILLVAIDSLYLGADQFRRWILTYFRIIQNNSCFLPFPTMEKFFFFFLLKLWKMQYFLAL